MASLHDLEQRMTALEGRQARVDDLVDLLEDVRSALRIFVVIGNGFKWLVGIGVAIGVTFVAVKKWLV